MLREAKGMTSEGLAEKAAVNRAHVNRAENHGRNFKWETLMSLAIALDVSISDIALKAEEIANSGTPTPPREAS